MYKKDLALNYLQWLICQKNKPNQTKSSIENISVLCTEQLINII